MKKLIYCASAVAFVCGIAAIGFTVGCEKVRQDKDITITLSSDTISSTGAVTCVASLSVPLANTSNTVNTLFLPLEWWVGDPSLGTIAASAGYSAVYVSSTNAGANTISVRDQRGNSGTIGITQIETAAP